MIHTKRYGLSACLVIALVDCSGGNGTPRMDGGASADAERDDGLATAPDVGPRADVPAMASDVHEPADAPAVPADVHMAVDAPIDAPSSATTGCAGHSYLFCEDFEAAAEGSLPTGWTIDRGWQAGNPAVTSDQHHSGMHALHSAVTTAGQNRARYTFDAALGGARGTHWGRVFYRVQAPAFVPTTGVVHNTLLALAGTTELRVVDTVVNTAGAHQFLLNTPDDSCCVGSRYNYHSFDGAWHCAEWHVDQSAQSYQFYFDGTEVADIAFPHAAGETRHPIQDFAGIYVGWRNYQTATTPYQSWLDDVAIDVARIGCN